MIKIFNSDAMTFETMGLGALTNVYECVVDSTVAGTYELNLTMGIDDANFKYIQIGNIIVTKPNMTDLEQAFVIEQIEKNLDGTMSVYAIHIAQYRTKLIPVAPFTASNIQDAFNGVISNSMETNPFTLETPRTTQVAYNLTEPKVMRDILGGVEGSLLDVYGGEYIFDNFNIKLVNRRGADKGYTVLYGVNLSEYKETSAFSWSNSITGVLPYYKANDESGTVIMGDIQYSIYADQFPFKKTVVVDFSNEFTETTPTVAELNALAVDYLAKKGLPSINIEVSFADVSMMPEFKNLFNEIDKIELGDTVTINNTYFDRVLQTRIQELKYNVLLERYDTIVLGDVKGTINDAIRDTVQVSSEGGGLAADELIDKGTLTPTVSRGSVTFSNIKYAMNASKTKFMIWGDFSVRGAGVSSANFVTMNLGFQVNAPSEELQIYGVLWRYEASTAQNLLPYMNIDTNGNVTYRYACSTNNTTFYLPPTIINISDFEGV